MFIWKFGPQGFVCPCPGAIYLYMPVILKDTGALVGGTKVCLWHLDHMIIMAAMPYIIVVAMPIYCKNVSRISFPEFKRHMNLKLGM